MTKRITSREEPTTGQMEQLSRLVKDVIKKHGFTKTVVQRILANGGVFQDQLVPILIDLGTEKPPSLIHAAKYIRDGWKPIKGEDVAPTLTSVADLELVEFVVDDERGVVGKVLLERAIEKQAMLGLSDAVWLYEHQAEIPTEMQQYVLVFAGTMLRDPDGCRHVAYLYWYGDGYWRLDFHWFDDVIFGEMHRLARRKSQRTFHPIDRAGD